VLRAQIQKNTSTVVNLATTRKEEEGIKMKELRNPRK
jgi:hypothetical protein